MVDNISADEFFGQPTPQVATFSPGSNVSADDFFGGGAVNLAKPEVEEEKLGFLKRFGDDLKRRSDLALVIDEAVKSGEQSFAEGVLQSAGIVGGGAMMDFLGEVVVSGGRGLSNITPDIIENPIKDAVTSAAHGFLNTAVGQAGLDAAKTGVQAWFDFKEANPRAARNIEAVVDIGLLLAPAKAKTPGKAKPTVAGRAAEGLTAKADAQIAGTKAQFVDDLIMPKLTAAVRVEQVGRTSQKGVLNTKKVKLNPKEQEISKVVGALDVDSKKTLQANYNIISKEVAKESDSLVAALKNQDVSIPRQEFLAALDRALIRLKENPLIVGDAEKTAGKILVKMRQLVNANKGTGSGLLKARKELDAWMRSQKGPSVFDPKNENALSIALREIRQTTNDFIEAKTPNVAVKESLRKQSNLLKAMDNIAPKAADEGKNALFRAWQIASKILPIRGEFNQTLAVIFGVGGLGAAATFAPFFTKITIGALGTYALGKALFGPQTKKAMAGMLKLIDESIRKTKDEKIISQLRLDRALIVEMLKEE